VRIDDEEAALIASFDGREVSYPFGELDTLVPGLSGISCGAITMIMKETSHGTPQGTSDT
jgi:hypothetical protein